MVVAVDRERDLTQLGAFSELQMENISMISAYIAIYELEYTLNIIQKMI